MKQDIAAKTGASDVDRELVITRVFNDPRELVWKAFTEPERLEHWCGPKASRRVFTSWTFDPAVFFYTAKERLTAATCLENGSITKSSRRSGWSSSIPLPTRREILFGIR
ncbi:MAG TPA: hypothetical protein VJX23_12450 [Candidatus Binataceae bacterium]|nr:hypothetical protein [Candidatus Binataceae bacterium]